MNKYKIEGSIDFFSELYKSLDDEENEKNDEQDNLCLITNLPLNDNFFKMDCGHKFNYIPLYFDIKNHKLKFNGMEGNSSRLNKNEIRCPYCRNRHKGVLPYYEELGLEKIDGVNYVNPNYKAQPNTTSYYKQCQFLTPNPNFNPVGENASETNAYDNMNCKYFLCSHIGTKINFQYGQESGENYGDEKYYCWNHRTEMIRKYKKEYYDKKKAEQIQAKMLVKQELKKAKEDEKEAKKQLKKLEKMAKELKKSVINTKLNKIPENNEELNENNVIGTIYIIEGDLCPIILKSGTNKGNKCGNKIIENGCCKRHCKPVKKEEST